MRRRVRQVLGDLERPTREVAREFVATLFPPGAPARLIEEQIATISAARPATRWMVTELLDVDL
jgi:hypothetical protein